MHPLPYLTLTIQIYSSIDTFIAQAYGAGLYRDTGIHAQRAMLILTVCAIPVAILWSQTSWILEHVLNIPHDTAQLAGIWSNAAVIGIWPQLMCAVLQKW